MKHIKIVNHALYNSHLIFRMVDEKSRTKLLLKRALLALIYCSLYIYILVNTFPFLFKLDFSALMFHTNSPEINIHSSRAMVDEKIHVVNREMINFLMPYSPDLWRTFRQNHAEKVKINWLLRFNTISQFSMRSQTVII